MSDAVVSPIPQSKVELLDFPTALRRVIDGKKITKLEWQNKNCYGVLKDGRLKIHLSLDPADQFNDWIISDGDLLGIDWIAID